MIGHSRATVFFTDAEKEQIKEATVAAESRTIGEIAVMVIDESSNIMRQKFSVGSFSGVLPHSYVTIFFFHESIWWYVPLSFLLFFPAWFLFKKFHMPLRSIVSGTKGRKRP